MARPRWLRHKLMLGLALVIGSVGLLLGGTLYGLSAYFGTLRTTERKLYEHKQVTIIGLTLSGREQPSAPDLTTEYKQFLDLTEQTQTLVGYYRSVVLAKTVELGLDPEGGFQETKLLDQLEAALRKLTAAIQQSRTRTGDAAGQPLRNDPGVRGAHDEARRIAQDLSTAVTDDIDTSIRRTNATIRQSLWLIGGATAWCTIIVLALLYYFRQWIYTPIKALHGGVQRVHGGDFDHPIRLHSNDELEELANEFNAMTVRLSAIYMDLARQVNERSRQLVRSERMVSVGFLAAGVAHEINNPLASILFCAEALERRLQEVLAQAVAAGGTAQDDAEVLARYLKMIQQEALRCKDITQKLLDFSRTGERKREATDLAGLIRGVLEVARHLPNCRGKQVSFNPDQYIVAPVNGQDLKSVILNLVVNALDSTDDGGSLTIRLGTNGGFAEMAFQDTGCGMAPEVLQNIFEPFYTRSRTGKGTGLGLFISHQIIDQHGGQLEAASPGPGHGSTFTVRVPLTEVPPRELPMAQPMEPDGEAILPFPGARAA